jgi:septal ring factor EnvC (AmiA/AmiB activator)
MIYDLNTIKDAIAELELAIADKQKEINDFDRSEYVSYNQYDAMLDQCYEEIAICGLKYSPSVALNNVDEVAYNERFNDYVDSLDNSDVEEYNELESELEDLQEQLEALEDEKQELLDEAENEA